MNETVGRAAVALLVAIAIAATARAAMYRCDGNLVTDRPVAGQNCVQLDSQGWPKLTPNVVERPTPPSVVSGSAGTTSSGTATPYRRPDPLPDWKPAPPKAPDLSGLPRDEHGRPILSQDGAGNSIVLEKRDGPSPTQALAICSSSVTKCYEPGERSLDQCWVSMPRCASATGSDGKEACCPAACLARYETERTAGATPLEATDKVLFGTPSCIPGVKAAID